MRPSSSYFSPPFSRYVILLTPQAIRGTLSRALHTQPKGRRRRDVAVVPRVLRYVTFSSMDLFSAQLPRLLYAATSLNGCPAVTSYAFPAQLTWHQKEIGELSRK